MQESHQTGLRIYFAVFVGLAILTGVEVAIATSAGQGSASLAIMLLLAVVKAALVALFFMHLRDDTKWFALIFVFPMFLASLLLFFSTGFQSYYQFF